jgi:hypothetical protein
MAKMNYEHVFSSAGFSGESFNIAEGYNVSYDTSAGDVVFDNATSTLILTTGTWPTWIREVGKEFVISGTTNNNGTFHTVSVDNTFKVLTVIESVVDETPVGVTSFDGSIDTGIIDVLLGVGNAVLTTDAPLVLHSTGALGAARTLDISALEIENVAQGGEPLNGRFFYLSIQNSDISSTNKITISMDIDSKIKLIKSDVKSVDESILIVQKRINDLKGLIEEKKKKEEKLSELLKQEFELLSSFN